MDLSFLRNLAFDIGSTKFNRLQEVYIYQTQTIYIMATLARTAFSASRPFVRPCIASSSRLTRTYATESTVTASEIYGTSKGPEGAIMKKYTGKGFPAIPVSDVMLDMILELMS